MAFRDDPDVSARRYAAAKGAAMAAWWRIPTNGPTSKTMFDALTG